jgi:endonuclease/exonuclease/phosphatase (EEP) superfamily protein YafD
VSAPADTARGGLAVYSRYAIVSTVAVTGTRWPAARITLDTGSASVELVVGRASPPGDGTSRWRSDLTALGDAARTGHPAALIGTLDATPDQSAFRQLTSRGLQDAAGRFGHGLRPTWPSGYPVPLLPLDHVVVGGGVGVRSVSTVPVAGSSHRALVAELVVPPTSGTSPGSD